MALVESFDRVIEIARDSISQVKVNAFDQQRVRRSNASVSNPAVTGNSGRSVFVPSDA